MNGSYVEMSSAEVLSLIKRFRDWRTLYIAEEQRSIIEEFKTQYAASFWNRLFKKTLTDEEARNILGKDLFSPLDISVFAVSSANDIANKLERACRVSESIKVSVDDLNAIYVEEVKGQPYR